MDKLETKTETCPLIKRCKFREKFESEELCEKKDYKIECDIYLQYEFANHN